MPLVAIATPKAYVEDPIGVYNLDFEMNIQIIKQCVKYHKRVVFPSTSEVYGACADPEFKEDESYLVVGPISKERWIYSCCKQLLDRVIYGYGTRGHLEFTLFRPFNWVGPRLDSLDTAKEGSSRVVTQFIAELLLKRPINLVDGGRQKRCFTYVDDGIAALMKILENKMMSVKIKSSTSAIRTMSVRFRNWRAFSKNCFRNTPTIKMIRSIRKSLKFPRILITERAIRIFTHANPALKRPGIFWAGDRRLICWNPCA